MKKVIFLLIFLTGNIYHSKAQTAVGGCNSVTLTSVPSYAYNLVIAGGWACTACNGGQCFDVLATSPPQYAQTRSWLLKKQSNGTFTNVQGGTSGVFGDNVVFNVTEPGIYKIMNQRPSTLTTTTCPYGRDVKNINLIIVGKRGVYKTNSAGGLENTSYSNEVFVGPVQQNQVTYQFVDGGGGNSAQSGFDYQELVRINTTGCQNFTHWWVAIFENDGPMRYTGTGWQTGPLPTLVNLTDVWKNGNGSWSFETNRSYTVQFALSNPCNSQWTNLDKTFFICPSGSGCREIETAEPISLSPNPTYGQFQLRNLSDAPTTITLLDISGRELKRFNQSGDNIYDVSDLNNGMYVISVIQGEKRVFNSKLSILK